MCAEIRRARLQWKKGTLNDQQYEKEVNEYMEYAIREQERMGMDVLVHGEPERTDMCASPAGSVLAGSKCTVCARLLAAWDQAESVVLPAAEPG